MKLTLTRPEIERYIDQQVKAGHFPSAEAVVEDALVRAMYGDVPLTPEDLAEIKEAEDQIERGDCVEFSEFAARMRKKYGIS